MYVYIYIYIYIYDASQKVGKYTGELAFSYEAKLPILRLPRRIVIKLDQGFYIPHCLAGLDFLATISFLAGLDFLATISFLAGLDFLATIICFRESFGENWTALFSHDLLPSWTGLFNHDLLLSWTGLFSHDLLLSWTGLFSHDPYQIVKRRDGLREAYWDPSRRILA